MSKRLNNSGNWAVFTVNNSCGQGGGAENGCTVFNQVSTYAALSRPKF